MSNKDIVEEVKQKQENTLVVSVNQLQEKLDAAMKTIRELRKDKTQLKDQLSDAEDKAIASENKSQMYFHKYMDANQQLTDLQRVVQHLSDASATSLQSAQKTLGTLMGLALPKPKRSNPDEVAKEA